MNRPEIGTNSEPLSENTDIDAAAEVCVQQITPLPSLDVGAKASRGSPIDIVELSNLAVSTPWPCEVCRQRLLPTSGIVGALALVHEVASGGCTVNVVGETGTGKEAIARLVRDHSPRATNAYGALNCGAVPESLIQAEILGTKKGAYTGAQVSRAGLFESADGGIVFLDEIGDLSSLGQQTLLRVLQEREVQPLGSNHLIPIDVRVITASHHSLTSLVGRGRLRGDLRHRLAGAVIELSPLRERPNDILPLSAIFVSKYASRDGKQVRGLTVRAIQTLLRHHWPGNVRELEHVLEVSIATLGPRNVIDVGDLRIADLNTEVSRPTTSPAPSPRRDVRRVKPGPRPKFHYDWGTVYRQIHTIGATLREVWMALPEPKISYPRFCARFSEYVGEQMPLESQALG